MTETGSDSILGSWAPPECPFKVSYSLRTLEEIRLSVMDAFFSLPRGGAEIGGILLGKRAGLSVTIFDHIPLDCEHAFGPSFNLSPRDLERLVSLLDEAQKNVSDLQPLGWYHSHTRSEIFLSDVDLEIHRRYFPNPWQIALVLKPHTFHPMRAGFFFCGRDGSYHANASYLEFALDALPMRPVQGSVSLPPESGEQRPDFAPTGRMFSLPERLAAQQVADDWMNATPWRTPASAPPISPPAPAPHSPPPPVSVSAHPDPAPALLVTEPAPMAKPPVREEPEIRAEARTAEVQTADEEIEEPVERQFWELEPEIEPADIDEEEEPAGEIVEVEAAVAPTAEAAEAPSQTLETEAAVPEIEEAQPLVAEAGVVETEVVEVEAPEPPEPDPAQGEGAEPAVVTSQPAREEIPFRYVEAQPPRRGKLWALLGLAAMVALGVFAYQTRASWVHIVWSGAAAAPETPRVSTTLGLSLKDQDGDLKIVWDRTRPAIAAANYGTLEISGGGVPSSVRLDAVQLATGSFTYKRETERVDVSLMVASAAGDLGRESASFMGKLPDAGSAPPTAQDTALAAERDALAAQVEKLKRDLRLEIARNQQLLKSTEGRGTAPAAPLDPDKLQGQLNAALARVKDLEKSIKPKDEQIAKLRADLATQVAHNKVLGESLDAAEAQLKQQQKKRLSNQSGDTAKQ
ncbi:MAG TPA: hypothetical protein VML19_01925 [Verrucomicrobiae bacterium]|nr:hypothetical protein [Verrucomicrobiae bacterium]